jgi:ElaB/YqjD/DUF883 family membrane-anchored ribosome-binding protein
MLTAKTSTLARDMRHVADEVENLLHDAGVASSGTVHELRGRVAGAMGSARERLGNVRSGASQALTVTDEYVHASPWQAIGAGLLLGLLAGFLFTRRY